MIEKSSSNNTNDSEKIEKVKESNLKYSMNFLLLLSIIFFILLTGIKIFFQSSFKHFTASQDGNNIISPIEPEQLKSRALYYYSLNDYERASTLLKRHILNYPADGEAYIYLSNSQILSEKGEKIFIGLAIPVTGADSQVGQAMMQGVALALKKINFHGINGKKIVISMKDDGSTPKKAEEIAGEFVKDERILAVMGHAKSICTISGAKIYNKGKLPLLSPISTSPEITQSGDYIFMTCASDLSQGKTLAKISRDYLHPDRAGIIYNPEDPYSKSLATSFKSSLNINNLYEITYTSEKTDFEKEVLELLSQSPDIILIATYDMDALNIIKKLREKKFNGNIIGGDALYTQKILKNGGELVNGLICTTFFYPDISNSDIKEFVDNFQSHFSGGTPNPVAAQAYDAINLLYYSLEKSKLSREDLKKTFTEIGNTIPPFHGIGGEIKFDKSGNSKELWIVVQARNKKFVLFNDLEQKEDR